MSIGIGGHTLPQNGRTNDWLTPPDILRALGEFDLDPCCPPVMPWRTAAYMIHDDSGDGLVADWYGRVWCNPPYGEGTAAWLRKMAEHGRGTALVFARTETAMFRDHVWPFATAALFLHGRIHFHGTDGRRAKGNAGGPSVLLAYGALDAAILKGSGIAGKYLEVNAPEGK